MVSQNVLNLVDTAMVGSLGNAALAAVGLGGFANFMCQAIILGISTGVQAMSSRRKGEGRLSETAVPLNGALVLVLVVALPLSAILYSAVPQFFPLLNADPAVIAGGVPYLQVRVLAITMVGINFAFRGYWNAIDLSKLYMKTLVVMHVSNIILNYLLIFGHWGFPALGVTGAGIGTAGSTIIGTVLYFILGMRRARHHGFLRELPPWREMRTLIRLSIPNGVQQLFFAAGFTAMYWIIGQVGTVELAASNILINVMLVAILPGIALGLAATTLVGQALGRGDINDAHAWAWDVVKVGMVGMGIIGIPMWLIPDAIVGIFIADQGTIEVARLPLRIVGFLMPGEALGLILMNSLLGAGDAKRVMVISIATQWAYFLPLAYLVGPVLGWGLLAIWLANGSYRLLAAAFFVTRWQGRSWAQIKV